jgi:hypothetical protein
MPISKCPVHLRPLIQPYGMRNDKGRIDFTTVDALQQIIRPSVHVGLSGFDGQPLVHDETQSLPACGRHGQRGRGRTIKIGAVFRRGFSPHARNRGNLVRKKVRRCSLKSTAHSRVSRSRKSS